MINILIRTSERPKCFQDCIESIKIQDYKKVNIIVGSDSKNTYLKRDYGIPFKVVKFKRQRRYDKTINTAKHFPYNLYFNEMYKYCKKGFVIILDDDDMLHSPQSLSMIDSQMSEDNLLIFRTSLDGRIVPSDTNWQQPPVCKDFSSLNIAFHTKYIPFAKWSEYKQGDFRLGWNLWGVIPNKIFMDKIIAVSQKDEGAGQRVDKGETSNKFKVLVLIPLWKRPEIFEICAKHLKQIEHKHIEFKFLCILSPRGQKKDPATLELKRIMREYNIQYCEHKNYPLGEKMNAAITLVLEHFDFDYLMNLDSDGIVNPNLFDYYLPLMRENEKYFGVNTYYALNYKDSRCLKFDLTNAEDMCICSGRMLHRSVLRQIYKYGDYLYDMEDNSGMDAVSRGNILKYGFEEHIVRTKEPMILDIKTNTQISHFDLIERMSYTKEVDFDKIKDYFNYS